MNIQHISPLLLIGLVVFPVPSLAFALELNSLYRRGVQTIPAAYSHCLHAFPMATEAVTAGVMAGLGDYLAQQQAVQTSTEKVPFSKRRSFNFILKGLGEGIMWGIWYRLAERQSHLLSLRLLHALGIASGGNLAKVLPTALSIILDLSVACPIIFAFWDIPFVALVNSRKPWRSVPKEIQKSLGPMLKSCMLLWTPVNVVIYSSPLQ